MKRHLPLILFPILLAALAGIIYVRAGVDRAIRDADRARANGDPAQAGQLLASVAVQRPELWEQAGQDAFQAGEFQTALVYLQNAQTADTLSGAGYLMVGDIFYQLGETTAALSAWETALARGAPVLEARLRFLEVHRAAQDYPAAIEDLQAIVALAPNDAQAKYELGLMLASREPEAALAFLVQAVELDENLAEAVRQMREGLRPSRETDDPAFTLLNVGRALAYLGEWALAAEAFAQAVQENPDYAEAWAFWGEAKEQMGQNGLAELDMALDLNPASLAANLLYALYHKRHGNLELALIYLHAAAALDPENPAIQVEIGSTLNEMGDFNTALEYYQKAVELAPQDARFLHLLAQFSFQNNTLVEEVGLEAARNALLLNVDDPVALDLMGYGYYLLGNQPLAQRFLFRALELTPEDPRPWFHLGLVSLALGENQRAYESLARAVDLDPASPVAEQAMRVLARYFP